MTKKKTKTNKYFTIVSAKDLSLFKPGLTYNVTATYPPLKRYIEVVGKPHE